MFLVILAVLWIGVLKLAVDCTSIIQNAVLILLFLFI